MKHEQWRLLEDTVGMRNTVLPVGLIVDSPWIPGYCGISNKDFYTSPEVWFRCYQKIKSDFPDVLYIPDWWNEFGMAAEPSGFGCKFDFYDENLPTVHHVIQDTDDVDGISRLSVPDPRKTGLMPLLLTQQKLMQPRIREMGEDYYIVSTRGPLTTASHLMSLTEMMIGIKTDGDVIHKILKCTTKLCINWLEAQLENVGSAKGILVLDDVTGFLGEEDYLEFAHPYLKEIFLYFGELMHLYHNDTDNDTCFPYLEDMGVDLFNFTHKKEIGAARKKTGKKVCFLGNVPPMALVKETPEAVEQMTHDMIDRYIRANDGDMHGLILSIGGGMPMGARRETTEALIRAGRLYRRKGGCPRI